MLFRSVELLALGEALAELVRLAAQLLVAQRHELRLECVDLRHGLVEGEPGSRHERRCHDLDGDREGMVGQQGPVCQQRDDDDIGKAIAQMQPGQISAPIRSVAGYYIYALRDRRKLSAPSADEAVVSVSQLVLPVRAQAPPAEVQSQMDLANTVRDIVSGCADLRRVAEELGAPAPTQLDRLRIADLSPQLRPLVTDLKVGEASVPTRLNPGILVIMVCTREDKGSNLPSRDDIADGLMRERLDLAARRYLRDLRRIAVVDIRG